MIGWFEPYVGFIDLDLFVLTSAKICLDQMKMRQRRNDKKDKLVGEIKPNARMRKYDDFERVLGIR